jgi:hypothetical protein
VRRYSYKFVSLHFLSNRILNSPSMGLNRIFHKCPTENSLNSKTYHSLHISLDLSQFCDLERIHF